MSTPTDAPCSPWTPTFCIDLGSLDPAVQAATGLGLQIATDLLWPLSGRRYGLCEATIRPCRRECWPSGFGWGWWSSATGWGGWPWPANLGGGIWVNCGCGGCGDSCACSPPQEVLLAYPVAEILEVVIDGVVLAPDAYLLYNHQILVRVDGGAWPTCNDLTKTTGVGAWHISATYGIAVPPSGQLAVGALAIEIAKDCAGAACALPRNITTITRQGVSQTFNQRTPRLVFGIAMVDAFLATHNPAGVSGRAQIFDIDGPRPRTGP